MGPVKPSNQQGIVIWRQLRQGCKHMVMTTLTAPSCATAHPCFTNTWDFVMTLSAAA
jgi:hypothetical protein